MLSLNTLGRLTLTDPKGRDFAPHGSKARGLLVLLATAPDHTRTRAWLQDHLWSDRASEQAAGSLRSALTEVRRALGPHKNLLIASRHAVSLDPTGFIITYEAPKGTHLGAEIEPFEDIDVRDQEFEHIIRDLRFHIREKWLDRKSPLRSPKRRAVVIKCETRGTTAADVGVRLLHDSVLSAIQQIDGLEVVSVGSAVLENEPQRWTAPPQNIWTIRLLSVGLADGVFVSCEVEGRETGRKLWSGNVSLPNSIAGMRDSLEFKQFSISALDHIFDAVCDGEPTDDSQTCAFILARHARDLFFRLDKISLSDSDRLFKRAFEIDPRGRYLAWRGLVRTAALFQHRSMTFLDNSATTAQLAIEALRYSPEDAVVQIISSQLDYIHQGNLRTPLLMAQRGVETNPTDPIGWAMLSNALTANDRSKDGYDTALRALQLSRQSRFQFYFEHFACMAAAALPDYDQALLHAKTALHLRPDFVSARRYEVALRLKRKETTELARAVDALRQHEPDFSPSILLEPTYPVNTLRRLPLIDAVR